MKKLLLLAFMFLPLCLSASDYAHNRKMTEDVQMETPEGGHFHCFKDRTYYFHRSYYESVKKDRYFIGDKGASGDEGTEVIKETYKKGIRNSYEVD